MLLSNIAMSNVAENMRSGEQSGNDDEDREPAVTDESTPSSPRYTAEGRFATLTESLGSESMNETANSSDPIAEIASPPSQTVQDAFGVESRSRSGSITQRSSSLQMNDFPPLLSSLTRNGRPRYDFVKIRENGRLQIQMVPNRRPELVAAVGLSDRLTLSFINNDDGQDDDHELDVEGSIQDKKGKVEGGGGDDKEQKKEAEKLHGGGGTSGAR